MNRKPSKSAFGVSGILIASWLAGCGQPNEASLETAEPETTASALSTGVQINCGGQAVAPFAADRDFSGGVVISHANTIDVRGVTNPAPAAVYQKARTGNFTYTVPGFAPGATALVRLHFAETYWHTVGARTFNVAINGAAALTGFDIFKAAGGQNVAIVREISAKANASGAFAIKLVSVKDKSLLSAIEIAPALTDCGPLAAPTNGAVSAPTTTVAGVATYECNTGFAISGAATRVCQADGAWSGTAPTCIIRDCGALVSPANGSVSAPVTTFGGVATYVCNAGFSLSGAASRACQGDGTWSGTAPACVAP